MSLKIYDEAILNKLKSWLPNETSSEIISPGDDFTRRLNINANKNNDAPIKLPKVTISRDPSFHIESTVKQDMSYDGPVLQKIAEDGRSIGALKLNSIPVTLNYQIDIYTKDYAEMDNLLINLIFKLVNNPRLIVTISDKKNNIDLPQVFYMNLNPDITDTSDIGERRYPGQFTRYTLRLEVPLARFYQIDEADNIKISARVEIDEKS